MARKKTPLLRRKSTKKAAIRAANAAKKAGAYGAALAKKHITKENVKKAIEASKRATSYLKALLHKKKKEQQRVTMTMFRK